MVVYCLNERKKEMPYATIASIDFDTITTDNGDQYKVENSTDIFSWSQGDSITISGYSGEITIKHTMSSKEVKAKSW